MREDEHVASVRSAGESDIPTLCDLYLKFHEFHAERIPERLRSLRSAWHKEAEYLAEQLQIIVASDDSQILVAELEGEIVGFGEIYLRTEEQTRARPGSRYCHVQSMFVASPWRGTGLGRLLMAASEAWARVRGATEMRVDVWEFSEGPAGFYERCGYGAHRHSYSRPLTQPHDERQEERSDQAN